MASNTIIVNILGNMQGLQSSLGKAQTALMQLQGNVGGLNSGLKALAVTGAVAGAAMGGVMATGAAGAAVALGSAAAGAAALAAVPFAFAKFGAKMWAETEEGAAAIDSFKEKWTTMVGETSKPYTNALERGLEALSPVLDKLRPAFSTIFEGLGQSVDTASARLTGMSDKLGPALTKAFEAGKPILDAVVEGLFRVVEGGMEAIDILAPASGQFTQFAATAMDLVAGMLPVFAKIAVAFAPLANEILSKALPAMQSVGGFLTGELLPLINNLRPAFSAAFGFLGDIFFGIGQALPALVEGINGFWEAMGGVGGPGGETEALFRTLGETIGALLPMFGQLLAAIIPVATQFLEVFGPAIEQFGGLVLETVIPAISELLGWLSEHQGVATALVATYFAWSAAGSVIVPIIKGLTGAQVLFNGALAIFKGVGTVLPAIIRGIGAAFTFLAANPIVLIIAAIVAVVAIIVYLYNNCEWFRDAVQAVWEWIKSTTETVWNGIKDFLSAVWEGIKTVATAVWDGIKAYFTFVFNFYKTIITTVWNAISSFLSTIWNGIKSVAETVWNAVKDFFVTVFNAYKTVITTVWNAIKDFITGVWNGIKSLAESVWNGIKNFISNAIENVKSTITNVLNNIKTVWNNIWNGIKDFFSNVWEGIKSAASNAIGAVVGIVTGIKDRILSFFGNAASWLVNAGRNILEGLWNGIKNAGSWLIDKITGLVGGMVDSVLGFLGINSPSRVFRDIGKNVVRGLIVGLENTAGVTSAATGLAAAVENGFSAPQLELQARMAAQSTASAANQTPIQVNVTNEFNGLVTDPVAVVREIDRSVQKYKRSGGQLAW